MRINRFVAQATGLSRRAADEAIAMSRVAVNGHLADLGAMVRVGDTVTLDKRPITPPVKPTLILVNKPVGYVCSRNGQGSPTIYELLPAKYHALKPVGRLDKDSSGLLLLTDEGDLANRLMHPRYQKEKIYQVTLDKPLSAVHKQQIEQGIKIDDYISRLRLSIIENRKLSIENCSWRVAMSTGRNRQIRRTLATLGYEVKTLQRQSIGDYKLGGLRSGSFRIATT